MSLLLNVLLLWAGFESMGKVIEQVVNWLLPSIDFSYDDGWWSEYLTWMPDMFVPMVKLFLYVTFLFIFAIST